MLSKTIIKKRTLNTGQTRQQSYALMSGEILQETSNFLANCVKVVFDP